MPAFFVKSNNIIDCIIKKHIIEKNVVIIVKRIKAVCSTAIYQHNFNNCKRQLFVPFKQAAVF